MKNLKLIIAREYMSMVGRKSFILMTIFIPILMIVVIALPVGIAYLNDKGSDMETIAVFDRSGRYAGALTDTELYHFTPFNLDAPVEDAHRLFEYAKATGADPIAAVVIPADIDSTANATIYSENTINIALKSHISSVLGDTLSRARVARSGVPNLQKIIDDAHVSVDLKSVKLDEQGNQSESSSEMAMALGFILSFITYMFVLSYGAMIMNGVIEEKTNRIVEVIVSSCRPFELMMGKIIGVALVGLTQLAIWAVMLGLASVIVGAVTGVSMMSAMGPDVPATAAANMPDGDFSEVLRAIYSIDYTRILICFVLYFIGGYLLYAALFAAFGSAVDQAADASQFTMPIIMIMIVALYAGMACVENPNGPMAMWCSMIPFTSPIVMMVRLPYDVPMWQLALSIGILFATAALIVWIAARIYRTGILLYGKKTSFKDLIRWMK